VALLLRALADRHPAAVEGIYSRGVYPTVASLLGALTDAVPFSVAELALAAALPAGAWWVARRAVGVLRRRRFPWRGLLHVAGAAGGAAGTVYAAFLVLWGLNYQREPLSVQLSLPLAPAEVRELAQLSEALVLEANRLRVGLPEDQAGALAFTGGLREALGRVQPGGPRPKAAAVSVALSYLGIAGIYVPFTGEAHVNATLPDAQVPFSAAHELAHRAGVAREDEANFQAFRTCRSHADQAFRYSGHFVASLYALGALRGVDRAEEARLRALLTPAVDRDVHALRAWRARYRSRLGDLGERVNDTYLKSQGQAEGVRSYGRMVDLMLAERRAAAAQP
jgi:hypothetical protein